MSECYVVQPIHEDGISALMAAGIDVRRATAQDMTTVASEIGNANYAVTRDAGFDAAAMEAAPKLRLIANHGIGTNKVDLERARDLGIPVAFTPTANSRSVAEHAMMLVLACIKRALPADAAARNRDFRFKFSGGMGELYGKTLGIAGFGTIGRHLAAMACNGFGMNVMVWSPSAPHDALSGRGYDRAGSLDELLAHADILSLHRPARSDTHHMIGETTLRKMKPGAVLVNTARGALIDEVALAAALREGRIHSAGLDVFDPEPLLPESPLLGLPNVVLTPHVAGSTEDALRVTAMECARHIIAADRGEAPADLVDPEVWSSRRTS